MFWKDPVLGELTRSLDTAALRQKVVSNNLANLNNPDYKRSYVPFDEELHKARGKLSLTRTHPQHRSGRFPSGDPRVITESGTTRRTDENNVDLDQEMLDLVTNQLRYNTLIQQVSGKYANWRYIINDGRG